MRPGKKLFTLAHSIHIFIRVANKKRLNAKLYAGKCSRRRAWFSVTRAPAFTPSVELDAWLVNKFLLQ